MKEGALARVKADLASRLRTNATPQGQRNGRAPPRATGGVPPVAVASCGVGHRRPFQPFKRGGGDGPRERAVDDHVLRGTRRPVRSVGKRGHPCDRPRPRSTCEKRRRSAGPCGPSRLRCALDARRFARRCACRRVGAFVAVAPVSPPPPPASSPAAIERRRSGAERTHAGPSSTTTRRAAPGGGARRPGKDDVHPTHRSGKMAAAKMRTICPGRVLDRHNGGRLAGFQEELLPAVRFKQ